MIKVRNIVAVTVAATALIGSARAQSTVAVPPWADKSEFAAMLRANIVMTYVCVGRKELPVEAYGRALVEYRSTLTPRTSKAVVDHDLALVDSAMLPMPETAQLIVLGYGVPCPDMLRINREVGSK
jgi:hypothetical protein